MHPDKCCIRRIEADTVWNRLDNTTTIIATRQGRDIILRLNATAAFLWELCAEKTSPAALADSLCANYDIERAQAKGDVLAFLEQMQRNQLVELS